LNTQDHQRWYDKNIYLKNLMNFLEHSCEQIQNDIAEDIIQIMAAKEYDLDSFFCRIDSRTLDGKRWYDKNPNLQAAVEMLKYISENEKKELFNEILGSVINYNNDDLY